MKQKQLNNSICVNILKKQLKHDYSYYLLWRMTSLVSEF